MNPASSSLRRGTLRALAGAALSAGLVATIGLVSSAAAEPPAPPAAPADLRAALHDDMGQRWAQHVQAHLDKLAERLEIKASQEPAWQKFSAAFRDTLRLHTMMGHPPADEAGRAAPEADAAMLARQQAERARDHAQKLAQLAEATAALQQVLNPEQRQVLNEAARHFAREHGGHGGMGPMDGAGHHSGMGDHCERGGEYGDHEHGHGEHHGDPHGSRMDPPHEPEMAPGEAAH
jgi:hypothetical protein